MVVDIRCTGSPYEARTVGFAHGSGAREQVHGSIAFYTGLFHRSCALDWDAVTQEASRYVERLEQICPRYLDEIRGLADGAGLAFLDILALNVRTEINFGLFTDKHVDVKTDGCTALAWRADTGPSFLAQNWDWQVEQSANIIICRISQPGSALPAIAMVTEAGIIGKIGLNSAGVGCCLNAIRARGVERSKLPTHLALRAVLESASRDDAVAKLESLGVAASAHILVADRTGSTGLECTSLDIKRLHVDAHGRLYHTNHLILHHPGVDEPPHYLDSVPRLLRIRHLADAAKIETPTADVIFGMLKDEQGFPAAINRCQFPPCESQTLFTIIMDLSATVATITFGRPTSITERATLEF